VTDIIEQKLELAKKMGADILINGKHQNLRELGN
jgi:threonine dehydrogenase-like Zn-dependent dehydrogenase